MRHRGTRAANRLLATAARLFAERGFLGVSVSDLVAAANTSRPVLYYHFGNKEGLYLAAARKVVHMYGSSLKKAASARGTVVERIRSVCRAHVTAHHEWALIGVPAGLVGRDRISGSVDDGRPDSVAELVKKIVAEGIGSGDFVACNASTAALAIVGAAEAVVARYPGCSSGLPHDLLDEALDLVLERITPQVTS